LAVNLEIVDVIFLEFQSKPIKKKKKKVSSKHKADEEEAAENKQQEVCQIFLFQILYLICNNVHPNCVVQFQSTD